MKGMFSRAALSVGMMAMAASVTLAASPAHAASTPKSQNGWTVVTVKGTGVYTVPSSKVKLRLRKGDAAKLLLDVAHQYDAKVENIDVGKDDWGWAARNIRGSSVISNHASGTAIDLNATRHPLGTNPTKNYSAKQIKTIHSLLKRYGGVIRWGGDYKGRKDGMHFEINKNAAAVHKLLAKLFPPKKPAPICPPKAATTAARPMCIPIN